MKNKIDLTQDSFLMIQKIYVNKDRTDFIYIHDKDDDFYSYPRVKMDTFENRDLSDLMWETMCEVDGMSDLFQGEIQPLTIPEMIDVLEDTGIEIIEE